VPKDLILFPEGVSREELATAERAYPESMIVGAIIDEGYSRGFLLHRGRNNIEYLKVTTDGRTKGSGNFQQKPVYQFGEVCVGVLICMDVVHADFSQAVAKMVRASSAEMKLICIPADMGDYWFQGERLSFPKSFDGIHVVLCNHTKTHQGRCKSFVTATNGVKVAVQRKDEAINAEFS
jgi:predicted amidohydrolase